MRLVTRDDIIPLEVYQQKRDSLRRQVIATKQVRRIHLGEYLTFLFETTDTIRYQVQEMLRAEERTSEKDILHELKTYNELLGGRGELGCTLLVEIDDPLKRDLVLRKWHSLPQHIYLRLDNGSQSRAVYDPRQMSHERLSAVQYLKFDCKTSFPVAVGTDIPDASLEVILNDRQIAALQNDLLQSE